MRSYLAALAVCCSLGRATCTSTAATARQRLGVARGFAAGDGYSSAFVAAQHTHPPSTSTSSRPPSLYSISLRSRSGSGFGFGSKSGSATSTSTSSSSACRTALAMVKNRGLEIQEEGATPLPGGMTLYVKAGPSHGPDGREGEGEPTIGDCPFAHYVRTVLHEKGLPYDLRPTTPETKPQWLIDHYDGSMPALRHRKECYTDSDVIAQYLDFFFQDQPLSEKKVFTAKAQDAIGSGLFPAIAKYLKHVPDGDEKDEELRTDLFEALQKLEDHLSRSSSSGDGDDSEARTGPYFVGNGEMFTLIDASLAPKLYHMEVGLQEFKKGDGNGDDAKNTVDVIDTTFPQLRRYMDAAFARPSFVETLYPKETIIWGWSNARGG